MIGEWKRHLVPFKEQRMEKGKRYWSTLYMDEKQIVSCLK
jgi:hypothetical protein